MSGYPTPCTTIEQAREAAAAGYPGAPSFDDAVRNYSAWLHGQARKRLQGTYPSEIEAADIVQETWTRAFQSWNDIATHDRGMGPILLFILKQQVGKYWIRRKAYKRTGLTVPVEEWNGGSEPASQDATIELTQTIAAVARLKPAFRKALSEVALGDPIVEIAEREGVSKQAVHQKVSRARSALLADLERQYLTGEFAREREG